MAITTKSMRYRLKCMNTRCLRFYRLRSSWYKYRVYNGMKRYNKWCKSWTYSFRSRYTIGNWWTFCWYCRCSKRFCYPCMKLRYDMSPLSSCRCSCYTIRKWINGMRYNSYRKPKCWYLCKSVRSECTANCRLSMERSCDKLQHKWYNVRSSTNRWWGWWWGCYSRSNMVVL